MKKTKTHLWVFGSVTVFLAILITAALHAPHPQPKHPQCHSNGQFCYTQSLHVLKLLP